MDYDFMFLMKLSRAGRNAPLLKVNVQFTNRHKSMNSAKSYLGNPYKNEILPALTRQFIVHNKQRKLPETHSGRERSYKARH